MYLFAGAGAGGGGGGWAGAGPYLTAITLVTNQRNGFCLKSYKELLNQYTVGAN
jgi:hypothetical protein